MFGWGIAFVVIGALSFILPLLGRQFILISLLGLTGMGSAIAGLIILGAGILILTAWQKKEQQKSKSEFLSPLQTPQTEIKHESAIAGNYGGEVVTQDAITITSKDESNVAAHTPSEHKMIQENDVTVEKIAEVF